MKTIAIAMALAVVASPALAKKAPHHKHAKHRHARVVVMDTQPLAGAPSAQAPGPMAGYDAYARAPRAARETAGQGAYSEMVQRHAAANGIPASLVHRVIMRESRYNPRAVSKGNYGMMQIRLGTARAMGYSGSAAGLLDPEVNMTYAVKYLAGAYRAIEAYDAASNTWLRLPPMPPSQRSTCAATPVVATWSSRRSGAGRRACRRGSVTGC